MAGVFRTRGSRIRRARAQHRSGRRDRGDHGTRAAGGGATDLERRARRRHPRTQRDAPGPRPGSGLPRTGLDTPARPGADPDRINDENTAIADPYGLRPRVIAARALAWSATSQA